MSLSPRALSTVGLLAMLAGVVSCGDSTGPDTTSPAAIAVVSSPTLSGTAGQWLTEKVVVRVTSPAGTVVSGVAVSFVPAKNSGSIVVSDPVTRVDGTASATWALGTVAGVNNDTLRVFISKLPDKSAMVLATVHHSKPETLLAVSGDKQTGNAGAPLPQPLVVIARDQFGNPVDGVDVAWTVDGGGTLSATSTTTDTSGTASVTWTMGTGTNRAHAAALGLSPGSATFTAAFTSSGAVALTSVSPATLFEGQSATITGTGFSPTLANDSVFVDGAAAPITSASATSLTITVPTYDCRPARNVDVRVDVNGDNSNIVSQPLELATPTVHLAWGEELIASNPGSYCLQLAPQASTERYLIGVQSISEVVSSLTPVQVTAVNAGSATAAMVPAAPLSARPWFQMQSSVSDLLASGRSHRWEHHRAAEGRLRAWEHEHIDGVLRHNALRPSSSTASISAFAVPSTVAVGDTIPMHIPDIKSDVCTSFIPITTVVRAIGARGVWLEDVTNPTNGYTGADFQRLSNLLDDPIYDTDVSYFGTPQDIDGNGRIVVVISKEVNKFGGLLGFVTSADLVPQTTCPASNEGEFFYGAAPDSAGTFALGRYNRTAALGDAPVLIAHEFTHIIQFEVRSRRGAPNMASWTAEGQATLAEEVVGNAVEGRSPGNDYGLDVAFNLDDPGSTDWYSDRFIDLATYFGYESQTLQLASAPQECSWLAQHPANPGPCIGGRDVYGVPWSILRWLSDQFGPTFPGGEQGLQRALIDNDAVGYANLANVVNVPIDTLLAQWGAMLYTDDRMPGVNPRLSLPSWNLLYIFFFGYGNVALPATTHLLPHEHPYVSFTETFNVRAGSAAYMLLNGTAGGSMAMGIRVRTADGGPLPPNMQIFVVRMD